MKLIETTINFFSFLGTFRLRPHRSPRMVVPFVGAQRQRTERRDGDPCDTRQRRWGWWWWVGKIAKRDLFRCRVRQSVLMIHVGGTRCVTSRTGNIVNIHARITWTVEVIRTCIFLFFFDV